MVYRSNKFRTAFEIVNQIKNWPTAWEMRLNRNRPGLRLLEFRNGINLLCRGGTRDWDVIHELFFAQSYGRALAYLAQIDRSMVVLDLGGNIGLFSLLASRTNSLARIEVFEPGPPNLRLLEMNCLANPQLEGQIRLHRYAVGSRNTAAKWFFDESNPGGSSLFGDDDNGIDVNIRSFAEIINDVAGEISLLKIDIEGAEYDILRETPPAVWRRIPAISLELHHDPRREMSNEQFLNKMKTFGYRIEPERVCSFFLKR